MSYKSIESVIRQRLMEAHAPALNIPAPDRVSDAIELLKKEGITTVSKKGDNSISIGAGEMEKAVNIMDRAIQHGVLKVKPQFVSAESIDVHEPEGEPVEVKQEPTPPDGGQKLGEASFDSHPETEDDIEVNKAEEGNVNTKIEPRTLVNRMENQLKKVDEEAQGINLTRHLNKASIGKSKTGPKKGELKKLGEDSNLVKYTSGELNEISYGKIKAYEKASFKQDGNSNTDDAAKRKAILRAKQRIISRAAFGESALEMVTSIANRIQLDEARGLKLLATHNSECGKHQAKVYRDSEWGEHRVKFFINGKHHEPADYHTDDVHDAHGSARAELGRITKFNGALKEEDEVQNG